MPSNERVKAHGAVHIPASASTTAPLAESASSASSARRVTLEEDCWHGRDTDTSLETTTAAEVTYIVWQGETYELREPCRCSLDEVLKNYERKSHVVEILQATKETHPIEHANLQEVDRLLRKYLIAQANALLWTPENLKRGYAIITLEQGGGPYNPSGVYLIVYPDGSIKFGQSDNCVTRVNRQGHKFAALMIDVERSSRVVPQMLVDAIKALNLPGLCTYGNHHDDYLDRLIRGRLCEMACACIWECSTNTILERIFEIPSPQVEHFTTRTRVSFPESATAYGKAITGFYFIATWATIESYLQDKAKTSDFLAQRIREAPPAGGFVKLNRILEALDQNNTGLLQGWEDSVPIPPRLQQIEQVFPSLLEVLSSDTLNHWQKKMALKRLLRPLRGDNYDGYVKATAEELAEGAEAIIQRKLSENRGQTSTILLEREQVKALEKLKPSWWNKLIDWDKSPGDLIPEDKYSVCLLTTKCGHQIVVTLSFFVAFCEEATYITRFRSVYAYLVFVYWLVACGLVSTDHVEVQRQLLTSYLMRLPTDDDNNNDESMDMKDCCELYNEDTEMTSDFPGSSTMGSDEDDSTEDNVLGDEDELEEAPSTTTTNSSHSHRAKVDFATLTFYKARILALPQGYFKFRYLGGVKTVARALHLACHVVTYMGERLGMAHMNQLITLHGYQLHPELMTSPLDPTWLCPGLEAAPGIDAEPCNAGDRPQNHPVLVGAFYPEHDFFGMWNCKHCHRKIERRELAVLEDKAPNEMTEAQTDRLAKLQQRCENKLAKTRNVPGRTVFETDFEKWKAVQAKAQPFNKERNKRRREMAQEQEQAKKQKVATATTTSTHGESERERDQKPLTTTTDAKDLRRIRKGTYPDYYMTILRRALLLLASKEPRNVLNWYHVVKLFDEILVLEHGNMPELHNLTILECGKPSFYFDDAYHRVAEGILDKSVYPHARTMYGIVGFDQASAPQVYTKVEERIAAALKELYLTQTDEEKKSKRVSSIVSMVTVATVIPEPTIGPMPKTFCGIVAQYFGRRLCKYERVMGEKGRTQHWQRKYMGEANAAKR